MIIFYSKTGCPWGDSAREFLVSHNIPFDERDMYKNRAFIDECIQKTGQSKCPTFDIDGHYLPDSDAEALKLYLESRSTSQE